MSRESSATTPVGLAPVQWRDSIKEKQIGYPSISKYRLSRGDRNAHQLGRDSLDPSRELRKNSQKTQSRSKSFDNDEIVKHMSNVPGFLQQVEKANSIQEKALNFGVLDWKLLARWKHNEHMPGEYHKRSSSMSSNSADNGPPKTSSISRRAVPVGSSSLSSEKQCMSHDSRFISQLRIPTPSHHVKDSTSEKERCTTRQKDKNYLKYMKSKADNNAGSTRKPTRIPTPEDGIHAPGNDKKTKLDDVVNLPSDRLPCSGSSHFAESKVSVVERLAEEMFNQFSDDVSLHESCDAEIYADSIETFPKYKSTRRASFSVDILNNALDEIAEQQNAKARTSSPSHRFGLNLAKISRSFSFREPSARNETSAVANNDEHMANVTSRDGKSRSFRKFLDPLLKQKSGKAIKQQNGGSDAIRSTDPSTKGPSQDSKIEPSALNAILQLTLKNGLPFFKFVVDNSGVMLAAAVKSLPKPAGSDGCTSYTVYSFHEIKQKSRNWITKRSKSEDSSSLGFNIIGHMTISTSYHPEGNPTAHSAYVARECVLYGIEQGKSTPSAQEIAAIVFEDSNDRNQFLNKMDNGTVVLLPGGIHGTPTEGKASSLISRWRSGGWCDCGGWDIGCKLRILVSNSNISNILGASSKPSFGGDHLDLYEQAAESKPVFSLELCGEGLYSVQLDSSISLQEAFATCIGYITCQNFSYILDTRYVGTDRTTSIPTKYVASPPSSPVGRI